MYIHLVVIVFLFLPEYSSAIITNECGGNRLLKERLNDVCETNLHGECPFGRLTCANRNNLQCTPDCYLTLMDIHQSMCIECRNNGTYSLEDRRCICPRGYSGELCEVEDYCLRVNCGAFGSCSSSEAKCLCDKGFSGSFCEINNECSGYEFVWDGRTCRCSENFDGSRCNKCSSELICIPSNESNVYTLARIPNRHLLEKLLDPSLSLSDYAERAAYRPKINKVTRRCTCSMQGDEEERTQLTAGYLEDELVDGGRGIVIYDDGVAIAYIDSVYRHQYEEHANNNLSTYISLLIFVIFVISILAIFLFCFCVFFISNGEPQKKKKKAQSSLKQ